VRRRNVWLAIGLVAGGLASCLLPILSEKLLIVVGVGAGALLAGLVVAATAARTVAPAKITDQLVWLRKVAPEYLSSLPPAPPGMGP
jgi:hypothetical protein